MDAGIGRMVAAAVLMATCVGCSGQGAVAFDPDDAVHVLDTMPLAAWLYEDEPLPLRTDFNCWSKGGKTRMKPADGRYVFKYVATPKDGDPVEFQRVDHISNLRGTRQYMLPDAKPVTLRAGEYDLNISVTLPSGKVVKGSFTRHIEVRRRELRLSLKSDKSTYAHGDEIVLTATVENIWGKAVEFGKMGMPKISLKDDYHDTLEIKDAKLPAKLEAGAVHELLKLRFKAGKSDARFNMGIRNEWFPTPFGRDGKYRLKLAMKVPADNQPETPLSWSRRPWITALPAECTLNVTRPKDD